VNKALHLDMCFGFPRSTLQRTNSRPWDRSGGAWRASGTNDLFKLTKQQAGDIREAEQCLVTEYTEEAAYIWGSMSAQSQEKDGQHRHLKQLIDSVAFWVIINHRNAGHVRLWSSERCHVAFELPPLSCSPADGSVAKRLLSSKPFERHTVAHESLHVEPLQDRRRHVLQRQQHRHSEPLSPFARLTSSVPDFSWFFNNLPGGMWGIQCGRRRCSTSPVSCACFIFLVSHFQD